jgi:hypothetical protein
MEGIGGMKKLWEEMRDYAHEVQDIPASWVRRVQEMEEKLEPCENTIKTNTFKALVDGGVEINSQSLRITCDGSPRSTRVYAKDDQDVWHALLHVKNVQLEITTKNIVADISQFLLERKPTGTVADFEVCHGCEDHPDEPTHPRRSLDCWPPQPGSQYHQPELCINYTPITPDHE